MKINIIHFSQDFRKEKGQLGAFSRTFNLTKDGNHHLIFTIHFGDETISCFQIEHLKIISIGVGQQKFRSRFENSLSLFIGKRILSYISINQIQVDMLFGHSQPVNFKILTYINQKLNKPLVWDANTIWGLPLFHNGPFLFRLYHFLYAQFAYRKCTYLIAQTEKSKQVFQKYFGINDKKISVITNSVNLEFFKKRKFYFQGFSERRLNIYFVGLFDELNGIDFILDNIDRFDPSIIDLNFVGTGKRLDQIEKLQMDGKLTYHGVVPFNKMPDIFLSADLLLIPRIRCFGSDLFIPTKLLEGMASGLLVLGSDVGGISEVIRTDQNGFLFKAGDPNDLVDQINHVISLDCVTLQKISDMAAMDIARLYNLKLNCHKLNSVYSEILTIENSLEKL